MDFSLSNEQRLLQDEIDKSLAALSTLARVRNHAAKAGAFADDLWRGLCDLGIPGALVPEAFGGLGLGILDAALIA